jgi:hypothetical protein
VPHHHASLLKSSIKTGSPSLLRGLGAMRLSFSLSLSRGMGAMRLTLSASQRCAEYSTDPPDCSYRIQYWPAALTRSHLLDPPCFLLLLLLLFRPVCIHRAILHHQVYFDDLRFLRRLWVRHKPSRVHHIRFDCHSQIRVHCRRHHSVHHRKLIRVDPHLS